jgi:hypothetical protein
MSSGVADAPTTADSIETVLVLFLCVVYNVAVNGRVGRLHGI